MRVDAKSSVFADAPLFPHDGYCLGVDVKPSSLLSCGTPASRLGVLVPVHG